MNIYRKVNQLRFALAVRAILKTPPTSVDGHGLTLLSMVQHRDVNAYLLAVKSFCRYARPSRIAIVTDPSITHSDREILRRHVTGAVLLEASDFRQDDIPVGGCWERLCAITEFVRDSYVIQLDADTVTLGSIPEVLAVVKEGRPFTLGTEDNLKIVPSNEIADWARDRLDGRDHVQLVAESMLDCAEGASEYRYVRGCAGFAGYPKGSFGLSDIRKFSCRMENLLQERWREWGSEQFSANVLLASMPGAEVLPHPKYCAAHRRRADTVFIHFIGYVRYANTLYANVAARTAHDLALSG